MRHFAFHVLELDGGMVNSEVAVQAFFDIAQNPLAYLPEPATSGPISFAAAGGS